VAEPVNTSDNGDKARTLMAGYYKYGTATLLTNEGYKGGTTAVAESVVIDKAIPDIVEKYGYLPEMFNAYNRAELTDKSPTLSTGSMVTSSCAVNRFESICGYATPCEWDENGIPTKAISSADGKTYTVYEVKDGQITIKGKQYPIKLPDGYYIIRKLTVRECARLQTMPDDYCKAVSDSQAYKALGNGWTAEVIIHLLNHVLKDVPRDEEIVVLSMYDGIATGRYCLDKMGFTNVKYHAYEIDKYPIAVAMDNYPDIIQHGDAFAVREDEWKPPQTRSEWLDELLGA
jgi:site-specific DNA-cytosine methylase